MAGNDALDLQKFMEKAEPMMLKVIEDAEKEAFIKNSKEKAAKTNAVDARANLTFPK